MARSELFRKFEFQREAQLNINELYRLATRCGMRLHECDAHLEYARLEIKQGQPDAARVHLKSAATLVRDCGYHRRDGEVAVLKEELGL